MNCPEHLVFKNDWRSRISFQIWMEGDYDVKGGKVPLRWWLNPLRYSLVVHRPKYLHINKCGRAHFVVYGWFYRNISPKLCKWFGIHRRMNFQGGEKRCHHCDIGRTL